MNESQFSASINASVRRYGVYAWKIAAAFAAGVPDTWYSGTRHDLWVEYKRTTAARKTFALVPSQNQWLTKRSDEGRACWLVVATPDGIAVFDTPPYPTTHVEDATRLITRAEYIERLVRFVGANRETCHDCTHPALRR